MNIQSIQSVENAQTPSKLFNQQVLALFKKSLLIYWRNKRSLIKDLLLPLITCFLISRHGYGDLLILILPVSLLGHVRSVMVDAVQDKSEKYKEFLKINGVGNYAYFVSMLLFNYFKCFMFAALTCSGYFFAPQRDYTWISQEEMFWLFLMVTIACTNFALFFSVFFSNKQLCADIGGFLFVATTSLAAVPFITRSKTLFYLTLLFPQTILSVTQVLKVEVDILISSSFSFYNVRPFILFDCILYLTLFFCFDHLLSDTYGRKKNWRFCFSKLFRRSGVSHNGHSTRNESQPLMEGWRSSSETELPSSQSISASVEIEEKQREDTSSALYHEKIKNLEHLRQSISLETISKSFGSEKVIDNLSFMAYEGQVFCLLGHNGAGKTTTINILTGMLNYDSGEIYYRDQPFPENFDGIRKTIGLCNQEDILYPELTVEEHMQLIGKIRGRAGGELHNEVESIIRKIGLDSERTNPIDTLTGGNKRKLSLGLAALGGTRVLFLDEPTAGMDPNTRRFVWDLIKDLKAEGRTIVLTTHHLDEADELSDRLGVMSRGKLFAMGSSDFIKKKFGVGYHLEITPNYDQNCTREQFEHAAVKIGQIVKEYVATAQQEETHRSDMIKFLLPFLYQHVFSHLFEQLETFQEVKLNLKMNSLEDAFVNIGLQDELLFEAGFQLETGMQNIHIEPLKAMKKIISRYIIWDQIKAMWQRKYLFAKRNTKNLFMIALPIISVVFGTPLLLYSNQVNKDIIRENYRGIYGSDINEEELQRKYQSYQYGLFMNFMFIISFAYGVNATTYCVFPVYERERNITYSLRSMGCRSLPYWLGTFTFDLLVVQFINSIFVLLVYIFDIEFVKSHLAYFMLILLLFGSALVAIAYFWGFIFKNSSTVFKSYAAFYVFVLVFAPFILSNIATRSQNDPISLTVIVLYLCSPNFAFLDALILSISGEESSMLISQAKSLMLKSQVQCILWLLGLTVLYITGSVLLHQRKFNISLGSRRSFQDRNPEIAPGVDTTEILSETTRVETDTTNIPIKVLHLSKIYPNKFKAVKDLSFGVNKGEIFGLLGPNGAGKSTTFGIITTMFSRTGGDIELNRQNIDKNLNSVYQDMGVCPQFDAIWEDLTVDEHLSIYTKIKGIPQADRLDITEYVLDSLQLMPYRHKKAKQLSGGNKRKLNVAIAIIGNPSLIFLDEPTTGVDPMAKRFLWSCLKKLSITKNNATILTTHSMEEAEALCNRIGMVVNGGFVCIGSLQYLKDKYGSGYKVTIARNVNTGDISGKILEIFPGAHKIQDSAIITETYQIQGNSFRFSRALRELEDLKMRGMINDFSIYGTTLEQVFIHFSKFQHGQEP